MGLLDLVVGYTYNDGGWVFASFAGPMFQYRRQVQLSIA
jgi:hypothetical protein